MAGSKKSASSDPIDDFEQNVEDLDDDLEIDDEFSEEDMEDLGFDEDLEDVVIEEDTADSLDVLEETEDIGDLKEEVEEDEEREPTLDEILKERSGLFEFEEEEQEEDEEEDEEDRDSDSLTRRVLLGEQGEIGADEFVCKSCFLVKHRTQLADPRRMLCRDCT